MMGIEYLLILISSWAKIFFYYGARGTLVRTYMDQGDLAVVWAWPEDIEIGLETGTVFISVDEELTTDEEEEATG
jgi:hypothetical protein